MKSLPTENITQAYSAGDWEYTSYDAAYAGTGSGVRFASVLRFDVPAFVGVSEALDVALVCNLGQGEEVMLRWAVCTADTNKKLYANTSDEVADENQIAAGIITISGMSSTVETKRFQLPTTEIKGGATYYLFLWAYNDTGLSIRAVSSEWGNHSITLGYNIGAFRVQTSDGVKMLGVVVVQGGEIKQMIPYIKTPSGLRPGS